MSKLKLNKLNGRAGEILHGIKKLGEGLDIKRTQTQQKLQSRTIQPIEN